MAKAIDIIREALSQVHLDPTASARKLLSDLSAADDPVRPYPRLRRKSDLKEGIPVGSSYTPAGMGQEVLILFDDGTKALVGTDEMERA